MSSPRLRLRLRQIGRVLVDLPVFLTSPLFRWWHLGWGATAEELRASMPGDQLLPGARFRATRAITIAAPPAAVWPWLVQIGCTRAGWYSHDLIDNGGRPSATTIEPAWQDLSVGRWVPMTSTTPPTERTAFRVDSFARESWLLWTKPDSTWAWQLNPTDGGTRLVNRIRAVHDWHAPLSALLSVALLEFGDFAMNRQMMRGIRIRAESVASGPRPGSAVEEVDE